MVLAWNYIVVVFTLIVPVWCLVVVDGGKKGAVDLPPRSRRSFLHHASLLVGATVVVTPLESRAQEEDSTRNQGAKPFAPLEALLPATRLILWIDKANILASSLKTTSDKTVQYKTLQQLNDVLSNPPRLFVSSFSNQSSAATAQLTTGVSSANKVQYKRNRADLNIPDKLAAMLNQADVERQWGMLQYQESKLVKENEFRAAFNYYTSQLEFGDKYLLTASKQDRSTMIRKDALPTLSQVITSDLDVRELYRNDFLTSIEDVKAEVSYQLKQPVESLDTADVVDLMNQAYTACSEWFNLIPSQDVGDAINVVMKET